MKNGAFAIGESPPRNAKGNRRRWWAIGVRSMVGRSSATTASLVARGWSAPVPCRRQAPSHEPRHRRPPCRAHWIPAQSRHAHRQEEDAPPRSPRRPAPRRRADSRPRSSRAPPPPPRSRTLAKRIVADGGEVLATYRDPLGSRWQVLASLPIDIGRADALPARPLRTARRPAGRRDRQARPLPRPHRGRAGRRREVLVTERVSPAGRDAAARREVDRRPRRARARGGAPDSRAQHREGAQPARAVARGVAPGAGAGRARRPPGEGLRGGVRGGGADHARPLLPGERAVLRRARTIRSSSGSISSRAPSCPRRSICGRSAPPSCSSSTST